MRTGQLMSLDARRPDRGRRAWLMAVGLALLAVLPLLVAPQWEGYRFALEPHPTLRYFDPFEQPLTVRSLVGGWVVVLAGAWLTLAYRGRGGRWWEIGLVGLGVSLALVRMGNVWLSALLLVAPLARQLRARRLSVALGGGALVVLAAVVLAFRPAPPPDAAVRAVAQQPGVLFASRAWLPALTSARGFDSLPGSGGAWAAAPQFWEDYFNISLAWHRWDALLDRQDAQVLLLDPRHEQAELVAAVRQSSRWRVLLDEPDALAAVRAH